MAHQMAELMEQAWSSFEEVCSQLAPEEWDLPTDCPGWSVKDQLSHLNGLESLALGRPGAPEASVQAPHVRNEIGALNEREIEHRRSRSPDELLDEYRDVTAERGKVLASWSDKEWDEEGKGVLGTAPRARIIAARIVDVFTHEQDIRVATGRSGHLGGEVARFVYQQMAGAMPFAFAKRAQASHGQTVVFEIAPPGETFAVGMEGTRANRLDRAPADPTVRLAMDFESFLRLTAGRWSPRRLIQEGRLVFAGDRDFTDRVLTGMNIMM